MAIQLKSWGKFDQVIGKFDSRPRPICQAFDIDFSRAQKKVRPKDEINNSPKDELKNSPKDESKNSPKDTQTLVQNTNSRKFKWGDKSPILSL